MKKRARTKRKPSTIDRACAWLGKMCVHADHCAHVPMPWLYERIVGIMYLSHAMPLPIDIVSKNLAIDIACACADGRPSAWLRNITRTLRAKNAAYGASATNPIRIFSKLDARAGLLVRIDDKLSRIIRGNGSGDEDALADLVGYLALLAAVS